jgi:sulfonate transport system permease protein
MSVVLPRSTGEGSARSLIAFFARVTAAPSVAHGWFRYTVPLIIPVAVFLLWGVASAAHWLPEQILPSPQSVASAFHDTWASGELPTNLGMTLRWLLEGYVIGLCAGLLLGIAMGLSERVEEYLYPTFKAMAYVPVLGWLPLWLVVLGVGDSLKVVLVAQASLTPVVFNVFTGVRGVSPALIDVGRVLRFNRAQLLRRIILPAAFPAICSGVRFSLTKGWLALVAIEILASTEGLGYMMVNARSLYQLDVMFVAVIVIGLLGYGLDRSLEAIEHRVLRWRSPAEAIA